MQTSLAQQKLKAYLINAEKNEHVDSAIIVFLGALMLISSFPFYPIYLVFILALLSGLISYKFSPAGVILSVLLAFPAVIYQTALFGWVYLVILALILFYVMQDWLLIAFLEIVIMAPFAFGGIPFAGWISILGMTFGALYFGSKKSLAISAFSVTLILLLSSLWGIQNTAYLPIKIANYLPVLPEIQINHGPADLMQLVPDLTNAIGNFTSFQNLQLLWASAGIIGNDLYGLIVNDSLVLQLAGWSTILYLIGYLPAHMKIKPQQFVSTLSLLLLIPLYYLIGNIYGVQIGIEFSGGIIFAIVGIGSFAFIGLDISRESQIERKSRMKSYDKFGMSDISLGGEEKSLDDIGGYDDVKTELRDSIMLPLDKKEIAYTYGIKPPSGILLFGPPGTGKTMMMRALSKELKYNFIEVKCSQVLSQWYGESLPHDEKLIIQKEGKIEFVEIGKIVEEKQNVKILSFDQEGKTIFAEITDWIKHKNTSKIYEVRTRTGRRIRVTGYHSLFTLNGNKIESIPTEKLIPGKSFIAIPKRIRFNQETTDQIRLLNELKEDDQGLYVKNAGKYLKQAIEKVGTEKVTQILGYEKQGYLKKVIRSEVGVRINKFMKLMKEASVKYDEKDILIGVGKKTLPGIISIDENFATFVGLWVAEGSYNRKDTVRISTSENEIEKISKLCEKLFGKISIYTKSINGKRGKGRDIYIGSRPLYVLLHSILKLKDGANQKKIPDMAFNFKRKNLSALLRGYFSGDGSISENQRQIAIVEASTVSKELANQILHLLLYFGIVGTSYDKKEWTGNKSYRICITGGNKLSKFKEIGFLDQKRMERLEKSFSIVKWFRNDQIPITGNLRVKMNNLLPKWNKSETIGIKQLEMENTDQEQDEFKIPAVENDVYLDKVKGIRLIENEEFVYDVSVQPHQNFVAGFGGIFAHNSEKNIAEVFANARKHAPTVLFFDEIDSIAKKRSAGSLDEVTPRVLSTLLQEMDGASKLAATVMVIGATNLPNELDPAILRPGRFDKIIYMNLPDPKAREEIFKEYLRKLPASDDIDYSFLVKKTERFSGADIKNIVTEAKGLAAKEASKGKTVVPISMSHFLKILGSVKPSTSIAQLETYEQFKTDFERRSGTNREEKIEESEKEAKVKWSDVVGLDDVKEALLETIELPLMHEQDMKDFQLKANKGILLIGPPGTGKTLIVRAAAGELHASFQSLSAAEIMKKGFNQAVIIIKEAFNRARENTPAIIFVDEIETFAPARGLGATSEVLGQFLTEMDGIKSLKGVVVMAATNKPSIMDPAIMRPGRFDKIFYIAPPDEKAREEMFALNLGKFAQGIDLNGLANLTEGFSGADIASICQSAKMIALKGKISGKNQTITTQTIYDIIKTRKPSITPNLIEEYERFIDEYGERK